MTIRQVDLVDYVAIAAEITGIGVETIARLPNLSLAESALHAPSAGFAEHEFYPGVHRQSRGADRAPRPQPPASGRE